MTDIDDVDIEALRAQRTYPVFGPDDDDFHDEVLTDRWWETETSWFSWNVPDRKMGGWTYCQARPNARLCNGGAWVWDDTARTRGSCRYHVELPGSAAPARASATCATSSGPNGVHVTTWSRSSATPSLLGRGCARARSRFDAIMPPNPHPAGVPPFLKGTHFDQPGRVTGEVAPARRGHPRRLPLGARPVVGAAPAGRPRKQRRTATPILGDGNRRHRVLVRDRVSRDAAFLVYPSPSPTTTRSRAATCCGTVCYAPPPRRAPPSRGRSGRRAGPSA